MKKREKTIKLELIKKIGIIFFVIFLLVFLGTIYLCKETLCDTTINSVEALLDHSSNEISSKINEKIVVATSIANNKIISDESISFEEKKIELEKYVKEFDLRSSSYVDKTGYLQSTDGFKADISSNPYFIILKSGKQYVSDPVFTKDTNEQIIFVAVPIIIDNEFLGAITCTVDCSYLSDLVKDVQYRNRGEVFVVNKDGILIGSKNLDLIRNQESILENDNEELVSSYKEALTNDKGTKDLSDRIQISQEVEGTSGWHLIFEMSKSDYYSDSKNVGLSVVALAIIGMIITIFSLFSIGDKLGKRLINLKENIELLASGNFNIDLKDNVFSCKDEIYAIGDSLKLTVKSISDIINSIKKNVVVLDKQTTKLNETSIEIENGANDLAQAMDEAAGGNTNQANEILNIHNNMIEFGKNIEIMNQDINSISNISLQLENELKDNNNDMSELRSELNDFNDKFSGFNNDISIMNEKIEAISSITKSINSIAEQTNLLALNAAIESARAGEAGKGFSVVAEEIRQLSNETTRSLGEISSVVREILSQSSILMESTKTMNSAMLKETEKLNTCITSFGNMGNSINTIIPKIEELEDASNKNDIKKNLILESIENTTAISEELAASTEEVSATSNEFKISSERIGNVSEELMNLIESLSEEIKKFV